jgi:hypothetical protein
MLYRGDFTGGCFCGAVRYRFTDVFDAGYCHCSICRRTTGAPAIAFANTPRAGFALTAGAPRFMQSSAEFQRAFCPACGTIMWTESCDPARWEYVSVHHGTIDDCERIAPAIHICHDDRLPWHRIEDALPRVGDGPVPDPARRGEPRWQE